MREYLIIELLMLNDFLLWKTRDMGMITFKDGLTIGAIC